MRLITKMKRALTLLLLLPIITGCDNISYTFEKQEYLKRCDTKMPEEGNANGDVETLRRWKMEDLMGYCIEKSKEWERKWGSNPPESLW
jgi:hypothetical protein